MSKIKVSALLETISGKVGTMNFSSWKGKPYVKTLAPKIGNPRTAAQMNMRAKLGSLLALWRGLSDDQRALWEEYAQGLAVTQDQSSVVTGSSSLMKDIGSIEGGCNAFIGTNMAMYSIAAGYVAVPPTGELLPLLGITAIAYTSHTLAFTLTPASSHLTDMKAQVWLQRMVRGGHPYVYTASIPVWVTPSVVPVDVEITEIRAGWGTNIQDVLFSVTDPTPVRWQVRLIDTTGRIGTPSAVYKGTVNT